MHLSYFATTRVLHIPAIAVFLYLARKINTEFSMKFRSMPPILKYIKREFDCFLCFQSLICLTLQVSALVGELSNKLQPTRVQPELKREASTVWVPPTKPPGSGKSDNCLFCAKKVYVVERMSAEGKFFHRACFRCDYCNILLRLFYTFTSTLNSSKWAVFGFNAKLVVSSTL